jgi:RND family efflux transporter MFP subunit
MNKVKNLVIGIVIGTTLIVFTILKLASNKEEVQKKVHIPDINAPVLVETANPVEHTFESEFSYLGSFDPMKQSFVSAELGGRIVSLNFAEGTAVSQGAILAKLDDEMIRLQLENLEVGIEGQMKDDDRYSTLASLNAAPAIQAEKTKLGIKSAEVQRKILEKQLKSTSIKAPYSGVITKKMSELGSVVGPGTPIAEITDVSKLLLTVNIPEKDIQKFKVNQEILVENELNSESFKGIIYNIAVQADKAHNFKVQVQVNNPNLTLRAGMYGTAKLLNNQPKTALAIPRSALIGSLKNPQVYVVREGKAKLTPITIGVIENDKIEILSGIGSTDLVITRGHVKLNLKDNLKVKLSK